MEQLRGTVGKLNAGERRFELILEASPSAIVGVNRDGRITYANPQVQATFGYAPDELLGEQIDRLVPNRIASHGRDVASFFARPIARPMGIGMDLVALRRDGTEFPVEVSLSPVEMPGGMQVFATITDITARKKLDAQLVQAQRMESVGHLAGGVAHDFNNLLTVISWYGELLEADIPSDDPRREYVDGIVKATERAANLTRQLLAFGRRQVLNATAADLNVVVRDIGPMLRRLVGEGVTVDLELSEDLPPALVDVGRLEQVLVNLVVNARDAMSGRGRLGIRTGAATLDAGYAASHGADIKPGGYVYVSVNDDGVGMDPATLARVFEPFFTTKPPGKGTGLGLSSVYGIVKQSGGSVWAYSEPGLGTTFKVYLPQAEGMASDVGTAPEAAEARQTGRVLIVEDHPDVRQVAADALRRAGYTVETAGHAAAALALIESADEPFDLLLTDVVMPDMTGPELAATIQARRPMPVLFMSGYAGDETDRRGLTEGDVDLIEKPFTAARLIARVGQALARSGSRGTGDA